MASTRFYEGFDGAHEMQDYPTEQTLEPAPPNTAGGYRPYLGLRARLSQVWINRWTVLLLLVLVRVLFAIKSLNSDIASAKKEALSACSGIESVGSAMASMPHYLSMGVNELAADGVNKAIQGLMDMIQLTVTGVEEIVLFVINMMTSTYVCLITLAITGATEAAISAIENVGKFMNETIGTLTGQITGQVTTFQTDFNKLISDLNSVPLLDKLGKIPTLDINSSIASLNDIQIDPTKMDNDLNVLNSSLPNFAQVQNQTNFVISLPFELIKKLINESIPAYHFNSSIFPVAQKQTLTFCSDNDGINSFFAGLTRIADDGRKVFIAIIIILAILACIPMAYIEIRRWRTMQQRASLIENKAWDKIDVVYIASRPYTAGAGISLSSRLVHGINHRNAVRWFIAYCTSLPALFLLALGITGLFSCLCQYFLLKAVEKEVPILANEVGDFAGTVVSALNNASAQWGNDANSVINDVNFKINNDMLGWVNISTHAINDTINTFIGNMTGELQHVFGDTILYQPILGVFDCLVGLKVASFEKGLAWVSDHAHIDFPDFPNNTFSLGAAASLANDSTVSNFLNAPGSTTTNDIAGALDDLTGDLAAAIRQEAIISTVILCLYLVIVMIALVRSVMMVMKGDKIRAEGGGRLPEDIVPVSPRFNGRAEPLSTRFPNFNGPPSSARDKGPNDDVWGGSAPPYIEKLGHAGHRSVEENMRPGQTRESSYGDFDVKR